MALTLPLNFSNDIQGKDTALVPVVVIGNFIQGTLFDSSLNLYLSTNSLTLPVLNDQHSSGGTPVMYWENRNFKPLLLNIPSLKESIDIEKRNYKISSINLDISNFPYEGERFSELVGDSSLINTECRIFWVSPSVNKVNFMDYLENWIPGSGYNSWDAVDTHGEGIALQVFFGSVRRYTHDDEKVRLVVEDRSQATLHKDLPLPENYLTGAEVPDKYKNKPIPMVYGHVDRSPGVISTDTIENVADEGADISSGTFKVIFDKLGAGISFLSGLDSHHRLRHSPLFVYLGEVYLPIAWFKDNAKNFMPGANDYVGNYENSNLIVNSSDSTITFDTGNAYSDSRFNNIRVNYPRPLGNTSFVIFSLLYFNNYNHINYDWNEKPYIHPDFPIDNIKIYGSPSTKIDGEVLAHHGYLELGSFNYVSLYSSPPIYIKIILDPVSEISDIVESKGYAFISASTSSTQDDRVMSAIWTKEVLNPDDTGNTAGYFYRNIETGQTKILENYPGSVVFFDGDFDNSGTSTEPYNSILLQNFDTNDNMINIGIPPHSLDDEGGGLPPQVLELGQYFKDLNLVNSIVIEGISNKTYYANIFGRAMDGTNSPTAPSAIKDILVSELGQLATDIDTFPTDYSTWKYAFTIDKKINSKKLIEGIASASPYIPRFDNKVCTGV